ncbi:MAG: hypothetical protein V1802_03015 [Candidatus Aenigmatarchaeota archaeon]
MPAKDARNAILALIILLVAIQGIVRISKGFITGIGDMPVKLPGIELIETYSTIFTWGLIFLIIILIPVYLSKRSDEHRKKKETIRQK